MIRKHKALGLGLFAVLAMSAFIPAAVSGNPIGGHFTNDAPNGHALLIGSETPTHEIELRSFGSTVKCTNESYTGTVNSPTVTEVTISPVYPDCWSGVAHSEPENATVNMNGCHYLFTIRNTEASTKHSPVHLKCPAGKKAEVTRHNQCVITFGEQLITNAATYTTITMNEKHALTVDITAQGITYEKHGLCTFVAPGGTGPHTGAELLGSVTLRGTDTLGNPVNITATGTDGH